MREIRINHRLVIPESEVRESFVTATGPGGQNVNKLATKVELRWIPRESSIFGKIEHIYLQQRLAARLTEKGELLVTCEEHRKQLRNREEARRKLAVIVREALARPTPRRKTKPTKASVRRRLENKRRVATVKRGRGKARDDE